MSEKLLAYCGVILLVAAFSFTDIDRAGTEAAGLSTVLLLSRVIPMMVVVVFCFAAVPVRRYFQFFQSMGRAPCLFWAWYAGVAAVSGFVSRITPAWSTWKSIEVFTVVIWAAAVMVHVQRTRSTRVMEKIFSYLVMASYFVCLWSIAEIFREGYTIQDYIFRGMRLHTNFPHINAITLTIVSLFALGGTILLTNRIGVPMRLMLMMPLGLVFALSRSRTGIVALLTVAVFAMKTSTISKGKKLSLIALSVAVVSAIMLSGAVREEIRLTSWEEFKRGAGRIQAESGGSGWKDTARLIMKQPAIGLGFVIVKRFLDNDHLAVDNFALQSLVVAGFIGAGPMLVYSFYVFMRWLGRVRTRDPASRRLAEMGMLATCLGFTKSITTNGMSVYGVSLLLFVFGALALRMLNDAVIPVEDHNVSAETPELASVN